MKYIIVLTFCFWTNFVQAQSTEDLQRQVNEINLRLDRFTQDYNTGYTMFLVGAALTCTALAAQAVADDPDKIGYPVVMTIGGFVSLGGLVKIADGNRKLRGSPNLKM